MLLASVRRTVLRDADLYQVRPRTAWLVLWSPPLLTALFLLGALHRPLFVVLTREDSVLEWTQVACWVVTCVAAAVAAWRLRRRDRLAASLVAVLALFALVAAGEEISWGQRLFGWQTPEPLSKVNHQDETTIHNIDGVQTAFGYVQLVAAFYGSVVATVLRAVWSRRPLAAEVALPVSLLVPAFLIAFGYRFIRLTVLTEDRFAFVKAGEMPELCFAFAFAAMAVLLGRLRDVPADAAGAPSGVELPPRSPAGTVDGGGEVAGPQSPGAAQAVG